MLALKLKRIGKKHQASFRLIVIEKRSKLVGKYAEDLGWYNPREDKMEFNKERVSYWIKNGAQPTDTVHNLLITAGIIEGKKIAVHKKAKTKKVDVSSASSGQAAAAGAPSAEVKPAPIAETKPAV